MDLPAHAVDRCLLHRGDDHLSRRGPRLRRRAKQGRAKWEWTKRERAKWDRAHGGGPSGGRLSGRGQVGKG
jgi:hypothetical protein